MTNRCGRDEVSDAFWRGAAGLLREADAVPCVAD